MTIVGTLIGTPIGIMAGTYLAEFGHRGWLAPVTRFINDILLSAPSIVIGLFVYEVYVVHSQALFRLGRNDCAGDYCHTRLSSARLKTCCDWCRPPYEKPQRPWVHRSGKSSVL